MTVKELTNEIFEKSFSRESLERLLAREIKRKIEYALNLSPEDLQQNKIQETLKSD